MEVFQEEARLDLSFVQMRSSLRHMWSSCVGQLVGCHTYLAAHLLHIRPGSFLSDQHAVCV